MLTQLTAQVAAATQKLAALGAEIDATQQKLDATRAEMERLRQIVRDRAAYMYQHADTPSTAVVDIQHVVDISAGKKYAESATQTDGTRISDLAQSVRTARPAPRGAGEPRARSRNRRRLGSTRRRPRSRR